MQVATEKTKPRPSRRASYERFDLTDEPLYGHPLMCASLPTEHFPQSSVPARVAHQLIKDELALDGNPKMNVRLCLSIAKCLLARMLCLTKKTHHNWLTLMLPHDSSRRS